MAKQKSNEIFSVHGPFKVPCVSGKGGRYIPVDCSPFWKGEALHLAKRKGCYVFGIRAAKGFRPTYVGMTKRNFQEECFTHHKIAQHYTPSLAQTGKGTPMMFLVLIEDKRGKPNRSIIRDLETFLIQNAATKNPDLSNIQNRKEAKWGIRGVIRGGKGKVTKAAKLFKSALAI
jgi:hypothetical protein